MSNIQERISQLTALHEAAIKDLDKFSTGNASAGTRARKALSEYANMAKVVRKEIQDAKNNK